MQRNTKLVIALVAFALAGLLFIAASIWLWR